MRVPVFLLFLVLCGCAGTVGAGDEEAFSMWTAIGGQQLQARFVRYENGLVTLERKDGTRVPVRLERLAPQDRLRAQEMGRKTAQPGIPKPTGRRELVWTRVEEGGESWPIAMSRKERETLQAIGDRWRQCETEFFVVHFEKETFARKVGRQADFFYRFIASDLTGMKDRTTAKSHIFIVEDPRDWKSFLHASGNPFVWAAAFVRGDMMMVHDTGKSRGSANLLGHEMTHLVLNRFFRDAPPLWLNEGLAEWYEGIAWKAFKGQLFKPEKELRAAREGHPYRVNELLATDQYPETPDEISRFYSSCRELVGFLILRQGNGDFVSFLRQVTVEQSPVEQALREVYHIQDVEALEEAFLAFLD